MLWRITPQHPATLLAPRLRHTSGIVCTEVQQGPRPSKGRLIGSHRFRSHNEPGSNPRRFGGGVTVLPFQCPFSAFCSPQSFRRPIDRPLSQLLSTVVQVTPFHASFEGSCPLQSWFSTATACFRRCHSPRLSRESPYLPGRILQISKIFDVFLLRGDRMILRQALFLWIGFISLGHSCCLDSNKGIEKFVKTSLRILAIPPIARLRQI